MLRNKRTATLTLPGVAPVTSTIVNLYVDSYIALMFIDDKLLTPRIIVETPNLEILTPATITLTDPLVPGRFVLISRNETAHNDLEYMVYYDTKYMDIIVIPSLEIYAAMTYIKSASIDIIAYGVTFSGDDTSTLPAPVAGNPVTSALANVAKYVNTQGRGSYYEKMVSPVYNYSAAGMYPSVFINFGTPLAMFGVIGFTADIKVFGYDSLFECGPQDFGKQPVANTGFIVAELPL